MGDAQAISLKAIGPTDRMAPQPHCDKLFGGPAPVTMHALHGHQQGSKYITRGLSRSAFELLPGSTFPGRQS